MRSAHRILPVDIEPEIELAELRRFLAVAEAKSFHRAAKRLGLSQPPLSRAIAALEAKLHAPLFVRTTRSVELTPAGAILVEQARIVLDAAAAAARRTTRGAKRERSLVVATKAGTGIELIRSLIARFASAAPDVRVRCQVGRWGEQVSMLADGRADVALLRGPITAPGIDTELLFTEPRVVALSASHRLARRRVLRRLDLADDPVCVWPAADPVLAAYRAGVDRLALESVPAGPNVTETAQVLEAVALGQGIAFVAASTAKDYPHERVRYVAVSDLSPSSAHVAWSDGCRSKEVATFVRVAVEWAARAALELRRLA